MLSPFLPTRNAKTPDNDAQTGGSSVTSVPIPDHRLTKRIVVMADFPWIDSTVYKLTVSPGSVPRFIHPDKTRAAKNVIKPWDVERLKSKWVLKTDVVYIGLAGSRTPRSLRKRLDELLKHASGLTTDRGPHKGGEIVWQLRDYHQFHLWAAQTDDPPILREIEETLLRQFAEAHGTLPFANRQS